MVTINILAMAESPTTRHYKSWKLDPKVNWIEQKAIKAWLMDINAGVKGVNGTFKDICTPISANHPSYPDKNKSEGSAANARYIAALKETATNNGKIALTLKEYLRINSIGNGVRNSSPLITKIFIGGDRFKKFNFFYDITKKKFMEKAPKKPNKNTVECSFEVDFIKIEGNAGFAVITSFEKSVNPNDVTYSFAKKGIDIYCAFIRDSIKQVYNLERFDVYVLGVEMGILNFSLGLLMKWNDLTLDVSQESYQKRIKTLNYAISNKSFDAYDFNSLKTKEEKSVIATISLQPRTINQRESNLYW